MEAEDCKERAQMIRLLCPCWYNAESSMAGTENSLSVTARGTLRLLNELNWFIHQICVGVCKPTPLEHGRQLERVCPWPLIEENRPHEVHVLACAHYWPRASWLPSQHAHSYFPWILLGPLLSAYISGFKKRHYWYILAIVRMPLKMLSIFLSFILPILWRKIIWGLHIKSGSNFSE